jgi:ABC-type antimicrobial peptide transport system permease subunit
VTFTYVLRNFKRRKARTTLMLAALTVGVAILVALSAVVDTYRQFFAGTVAGTVGDFDLVITRPETMPDPFLRPGDLVPRVAALPGVDRLSPRIQSIVNLHADGQTGDAPLVALDPATDTFGAVTVTEGKYDLGEGADGLPGAVVLRETADTFGLHVGDAVEIQYAAPVPRLAGRAPADNSSRRRSTATWIVRGIGTQRGLTGQDNNQGVVVGLAQAQRRFGLTGLADRLVVGFAPALYHNTDAQRAAFDGRAIAFRVRAALGVEDYSYAMPRPRAVSNGANAFVLFQALITMYGLLSLGVVGLLIRTLIMTNVQEQTRDMAILRILGSPRRRLFNMVMAEVAVIGVVGIGLGVLIGQIVNNVVIVPLFRERAGALGGQVPLVSTSAVLIAVAVASVVLVVSALAPARTAAGTKITHAINPSVAEGIGLEELAAMRERRADFRITGAGLVILFFPLLVFFAFPLAFDFGIIWLLAIIFIGALLALIVGAAMVFFLGVLPMERGLLFLMDRVSPKTGYFVRPTVLRSKQRNTLISLMIVVSTTLPAFLSTTYALEVANTDIERRLDGGAPFRVSPTQGRSAGGPVVVALAGRRSAAQVFKNDLLAGLRADPGFAGSVGLTAGYRTTAKDGVGLKDTGVQVVGADGDLRQVLYPEAVEFEQGDANALARLTSEPNTAIIGAGLANFLGRGVGDTLVVVGAGRDHDVKLTVVGVANRVGGVGSFSSKQTEVWSGSSTVLTGLDTYRDLSTDPLTGPVDPRAEVLSLLLATPAAGVDETRLTTDLRIRYATAHDLIVNSTAETIKSVREESATAQLFLIILTALTSALAVFGVFTVVYVSIYGRRLEIGMLKAVGSPGRHLLKVFVGEAMVMTLAAALTGVVAGVCLGYILRVSQNFQQELPVVFAFDPVIIPGMLLLMIFTSFFSAVVATYGYRRQRAIDILRSA